MWVLSVDLVGYLMAAKERKKRRERPFFKKTLCSLRSLAAIKWGANDVDSRRDAGWGMERVKLGWEIRESEQES
jgi:hypothetical protein